MKCDMHKKNVVPFLCDIIPCKFINRYHRFRRVCYLSLQYKGKRRSQNISSKHRNISIRVNHLGVTPHKEAIFSVTAVRNSNFAKIDLCEKAK
jgi:hypothetical protein